MKTDMDTAIQQLPKSMVIVLGILGIELYGFSFTILLAIVFGFLCMQMSNDGENYTMLDIVGGVTYKVSKTKFKKLFYDGNIRAYGYRLLPLKIINMPELATNLSEHILVSETKDPADKEIIVAWETEVSVWLNNGGDINKLYKNYKDKHAITRMLIDLKFIRSI